MITTTKTGSVRIPRTPVKGEAITADWARSVCKALDDLYRMEYIAMYGGTTNPATHRFQIIGASETTGVVTTPKITLIPGTVDDLSPVVGSTTIDTTPAPKLTLNEDVKNIIVLKVTYTADTYTSGGVTILLNNGTITDPEIMAYDDGSVPSDTDPTDSAPVGTYYTRIGYVDVNADGVITKIENDGVRTSLVSHYCASSGSMYYSMI